MRARGSVGNTRWTLIRRELALQLRRSRTAAVIGALVVAAPAALAITVATGHTAGFQLLGGGSADMSVRVSSSGLALPLVLLSLERYFVIPLIVSIFAGEALAGEAAWGSLRYLLADPVRRRKVLTSKMLVAAGLSLVAVVGTAVVGVAIGLAFFGWHPVAVMITSAAPGPVFAGGSFHMATLSPGIALYHLAAATLVVALTMAGTFAFAALVSTMTSSPAVAIASGVGFLMVSRAVANIPGFSSLVPYLPTAYGIHWADAFAPSLAGTANVWKLLAVQCVYAAVLYALAVWRFRNADVAY